MSKETSYSRLTDKQNKTSEIKDLQDRMTDMQKKAVSHIASIPEGRIFLNILMRKCGFQEPSIVQNLQTGEINTQALLVNEAIRGLYLEVRKMIPTEKVKEIEFLNLRELAKAMVKEEKGDGK